MKLKKIVAIDPSHSGFGIAWLTKHHVIHNCVREPTAYNYLTGKDKPGIGCPNLCRTLYDALGDLRDWIIVIEEPRGFKGSGASLNRDIGYIRCYFKEPTIILCQPSDWKKYLEKCGYLPPKSGNLKPDKYKAILDARFKIKMVEDKWVAWAICLWAIENMESE